MKPDSKPKQEEAKTTSMLARAGVPRGTVALLGVRGYYRDTMGVPGKNDRAIYDDAIILRSPTVYATFNANTDPSVTRPRVATLEKGRWLYKIGKHKWASPLGYKALVQAGPVTVRRDDLFGILYTGYFGINIHKGSWNSTSSLGCQTIHPSQWEAFITLVESEIKRHGQTALPYVLVEL